MRRAERMFQIVQNIGASQWTTAQSLAERLAVSERTIYRDIDHLSASGVPVYSQAGKGYALLKGYQLPPLMFSVEEWQALLTGLAMLVALLSNLTLLPALLITVKPKLRAG